MVTVLERIKNRCCSVARQLGASDLRKKSHIVYKIKNFKKELRDHRKAGNKWIETKREYIFISDQ